MDQNIFREYDIRGIVGEQLTDDTVSIIGRAIGQFFRDNGAGRVALGYDARESSPVFCRLLSQGFNAAGLDVVLIGMVPTPVLYHTVFTKPVDGGVMITGSHNPPDHNGFKICLGKQTLFGSQIQEIKQIALSKSDAVTRYDAADARRGSGGGSMSAEKSGSSYSGSAKSTPDKLCSSTSGIEPVMPRGRPLG